jgi:ADP-heptose:LPS heptosyltransferase
VKPEWPVSRVWVSICDLCLDMIAGVLYRHRANPDALRVLVVREGYIGDLLVSIPALNCLRRMGHPDAKIALLTYPTSRSGAVMTSPAAELLRDWGFIDEIIYSATRLGRPVREALARFRPARVVLMPYSGKPFKSRLLQLIRLRLLSITVRPEGFRFRSVRSQRRRLPNEVAPEPHQALAALRAVGATAQDMTPDANPPIPVLQVARRAALAALKGAGERPLIALGCSAKYWHKRWPVESYQQVLESVAEQYNAGWVILGTLADEPIAAQLERTAQAFTVNLCGQLSLSETAEVARMCALYLGNDTGLAHLCAALGVPTITLFSGIHRPGVWEPWTGRGVTLRANVPCQGCRSEYVCPTADKRCMTSITTVSVIDAVHRALRGLCSSSAAPAGKRP